MDNRAFWRLSQGKETNEKILKKKISVPTFFHFYKLSFTIRILFCLFFCHSIGPRKRIALTRPCLKKKNIKIYFPILAIWKILHFMLSGITLYRKKKSRNRGNFFHQKDLFCFEGIFFNVKNCVFS